MGTTTYRITSKKQQMTQSAIQFEGILNAGYNLTYTYGNSEGKKFQLNNVRDINYRTEETPTDSTNINNGHKYAYDLNGNLVYINTTRVKHDGKEDDKASEQKYKWDEENRLLAADENYSIKREQSQTCLSYAERENNRPKVNGFVSNYWYDADGERTVKTSGENEAIYVNYRASRTQWQTCLSIAETQPIIRETNSEFSGGNTGTARFSLYVSPYLVAGQGGKYTKHIYVGSQRIVSKLGNLASYGADPRRIPYAGNEADGLTINYKDKYAQQLQSIKDNYKTFDLPYNGQDNNDYVNGKGFSSNDDMPEAAQARAMARIRAASGNFKPNDEYEKMQFYYHPDHLGSSSYITNLDGEVSQHIEYVPFGEVFIEERNNTWNTPYLFNAKEFDEETGMYYYGARYYEPRLSLWMSTDPKQDKYPNVSSYCYVMDNPIKLIDPDGKDVLIWYKDKHGRDQLFRFSGFHGKKSIKIPNNQYVKDFIQAYLYNAKHGGGKKTIQAVSNHKYEIYVSDSQNDETYYSGGDRQPTVYWESRQGLKTTEGGKQSAATALEHEMDHAVDDANNHKQHVERRQMGDSNYDNKEERRVITGSEAQTAKGNKEAVRINHRGTSYRTASPTSTTPSK